MSAGLSVCRLESPPVRVLSHAQPVQQMLPFLSHHRLYQQLGHLTACSVSCATVRRIQRSELAVQLLLLLLLLVGSGRLITVKVPGRCPLVLLVKIGWKQGNALGSEDGKVMGSDCW